MPHGRLLRGDAAVRRHDEAERRKEIVCLTRFNDLVSRSFGMSSSAGWLADYELCSDSQSMGKADRIRSVQPGDGMTVL